MNKAVFHPRVEDPLEIEPRVASKVRRRPPQVKYPAAVEARIPTNSEDLRKQPMISGLAGSPPPAKSWPSARPAAYFESPKVLGRISTHSTCRRRVSACLLPETRHDCGLAAKNLKYLAGRGGRGVLVQ